MFKKLFITFLVSSTLLPQTSFAKTSYLKYNNSKTGYSIKYPSDWQTREENNDFIMTMFTSPAEDINDNFYENTNVVVEKAPGYTVQQYFDANLKNMEAPGSLQDFKILEQGKTIVNGKKSIFVAYTHTYNQLQLKVLAYFFCNGKNGYVITSTASPESFSKYEANFKSIVNSFILK